MMLGVIEGLLLLSAVGEAQATMYACYVKLQLKLEKGILGLGLTL
jgi:hypothetical protein